MPQTYAAQTNTWKAVRNSLRLLPFASSCQIAPDQHDTANNTMTRNRQLWKIHSPHPKPRLPSPARAAVFKLTTLKLLKRPDGPSTLWQKIAIPLSRGKRPHCIDKLSTPGTQV